MRNNGLETPLLQKRLLDSWDSVVGDLVARYTTEKVIRNQTLYVRISSPAMRSDLSMRKTELVRLLNNKAGGQVIADIKIN